MILYNPGMVRRALLLSAVLVLSVDAGAAVTLQELRWQLPTGAATAKPVWHDAAGGWLQPPAAKLLRPPRLLVTLLNGGGKAEEAVLLRYTVSARLASAQGGTQGVWTLPFVLEERRVPKVKASAALQVPITLNRALFDAYLKRMLRSGFWPDALRMQVMVEPRPGDSSFEGRVAEAEMSVLWKQPGSGGTK